MVNPPIIFRITALGKEKKCVVCKKWWPYDPEFFFRKGRYLRGTCKACDVSQRGERRRNAKNNRG